MRKLLLALAALMFAWAAMVYVSGGIALRVGGGVLRSRDPLRAFVLGTVLLLVQAVIYREQFARDSDRGLDVLRRVAVPLVVVAALALGFIGVRWGTFSAGSSDSYGYVSQAYGWARGELPRAAPLPIELPGLPDRVQSPLGYRPRLEDHLVVPTYAPGLPLMMAAALVLGACGPYLIVPACGGALIWLTFVWGRQAAGPLAGLIAAFLVLVSPIVIFQVLWPMSDIPAAALWTGAAVAALRGTRRGAIAAGVLTAVGLLVRPNLPLVVLVFIAQVAISARGRERWIRVALAGAPVAMAATFVALLNARWYGSPLNSGYGAAEELYALASVGPNLARYPVWFWQSHSGWVLAGLAPLLPWFRPAAGRDPIRLAYVLAAATFVSYVAYSPFDDWWYLRFMLPAAGAVAVLIATGIVAIARRLPPLIGRGAALLVVALFAIHTTRFSSSHDMFGGVKEQERRYIDIGAFVSRSLPDNAIVLTMQHSGGVRFYGGRMTIRYDFLPSGWIARGPGELQRLGWHPYMVIDDWEAPYVRAQFQWPPDARLPWTLVARMQARGGVSVYDMSPAAPAVTPVAIESGRSPLCLAPRPILLVPRRP